jgi:hypothetical protein
LNEVNKSLIISFGRGDMYFLYGQWKLSISIQYYAQSDPFYQILHYPQGQKEAKDYIDGSIQTTYESQNA